jgi:O-antigen/teichoic acid export membrane protein
MLSMLPYKTHLFKIAWNSPTLTAWGNMGTQSLRLVLVLPLVLKQFTEVEVAAWLLFSSLAFLGVLLSEQVTTFFSRMVALGMGGAEDLSPVMPGDKPRGSGTPNWSVVRRTYGTVGTLSLGVAAFGTLTTFIVGLFSLLPLLDGAPESRAIWGAFLTILSTQAILYVFKKYSIALRGMNYVALTNRWNAFFGIFSTLAGASALLMGAGILILAVIMQAFQLVGVFRFWYLLHYVAEPRFRKFPAFRWDQDIIRWASIPLVKAMVQTVANKGSLKISTIFVARYGDPSQVASFLLAVRLLETLGQFAFAPFSSKVPKFARMLAAGDVSDLRRRVIGALKISQWLLVLGSLCIAFLIEPFLRLIGSEVEFVPVGFLLVMGGLFVLVFSIRQGLSLLMIGNNIFGVNRLLLATGCSVLVAVLLIPIYPLEGAIIAAFFPIIIMLNWKPFEVGAKLMGIRIWEYVIPIILYPWILYIAIFLVYFIDFKL